MCSLDTEQFIIVTLIVLKETLIDHLLCARCCIYNNKQYEVLPPKNLTKTLIKFQGDTKVFSWNKVKAEIREGSVLLEKKRVLRVTSREGQRSSGNGKHKRTMAGPRE